MHRDGNKVSNWKSQLHDHLKIDRRYSFMANGANLTIYEPNSPLIHFSVIDLDDIATRYNHSS